MTPGSPRRGLVITLNVLFAQRLQTGPVTLRQSESVLDLVIERMPTCSLSEGPLFKAEPSSLPHSMAVTEILGKGAKRKSLSGRGQACVEFQHDGGLPNLQFILGISESTITSLSDLRGENAFPRALLLAGLEIPCDAARLQFRSSSKRGERRRGASLPVPRSRGRHWPPSCRG